MSIGKILQVATRALSGNKPKMSISAYMNIFPEDSEDFPHTGKSVGVNLVMRNKQDIKVSSLRDFLRAVSVRGLKPAVNKVSLLQGAGWGWVSIIPGRCH
jgi:hypothetical protein